VLNDAPYVALAGGANIDIHGRASRPMRAQDSNPGEIHIAAGGVVRNVAENLARLGTDARLISVVGDDQHGQMLLRLSREAGIDVHAVQEIPFATTSTYLAVLDDDGDMLLAINDMQIIEQLRTDLLQPFAAMLKQASVLVVDANLPAATLDWLLATAGSIPVFADTVSAAKAHRLQPCLPHIHTLKTGALEIEALTGHKAGTQAQLGKAAAALHAAGVRRVFVTRGNKGVFYSDGNEQGARAVHLATPDIRNASGAGDAFLAGLAYSWLQDWDLQTTLCFAQAAADITLTHPGTNHPELSLARVQEAMEVQNA
jgi:pseudouridine kinase